MAPQITDGQIAAEEALKPLEYGEGPKIGLLGDSRCGKTQAARELIKGYMKRSPGTVLVIDCKDPTPQFEGQYRRDRAEVERKPPDPDGPRVIVFRGERFDRETGEVDPETIADMQWELAQKKHPTLVVYDELDKACTGGQWVRGSKSTILWAFRRGGSSGAASLWGTQETQEIPAAAFNQSGVILCFRLQGAPLRLLGQRGYLLGGVEKVIPTLPGHELPPEQRGYFVLLRRGLPWDGKTYRFKKT